MNVLLDTSAIIDIQRKAPNAKHAWERLEPGEARISTVSIAELMVGAHLDESGKHAKRLERLLAALQPVDVTPAVARAAGKIHARRIRRGAQAEFADALIQASAQESGCDVIVTENTKHFTDAKADVQTLAEFGDRSA